MTIKEEIQIEEYKRTFAEAYKQGFIDAMNVYKTEPQKDLLITEYPQDGEVYIIGRDKTEAVVMAYDVYKELTEAQTEVNDLYDQIVEDIDTRVKCANAKKVDDEPQTTSTPYKVDTSSICKIEPHTKCPKTCPSIDICTKDATDCAWKKG